ncbi:hypothetical protein IQ06DRAFT_311980 [Phaeosphaeriaceae sp. SRC1lsM3a]|nr:hypothetical protein IQ06DRAFT_311980 [Stagonospora sp. SRC1lsM3a]
MTDSTPSAPAPKKRSLFKRSAWQDTPKKEDEDMFSHASQFKDIVAEQTRMQAEKRAQAGAAKKQKRAAGPADRKRRKTSSSDHEEITVLNSSPARADRANSKTRSRTPLSPYSPPAPSHQPTSTQSVVIDLGDSDDDDFHPATADTRAQVTSQPRRSPIRAPTEDDDHVEEPLDPTLAALAARARERAAARARSTAVDTGDGESTKAPIAQLFISPEIPDAKPLMVKVRIDSTLARTRLAWCDKQGYTPEMTKSVFFTWKHERVYDSTTVQRLGIQVGRNGILSVEGDSNIYDDVNHPKIYVQAWTDALFQQHKREKAAAAAAKKKAAEPPPVVEERTPTPEPVSEAKKIRLIMKAKGKEDYRLSVNPHSTFTHIAHAYKKARGVDESQPITLMFDGDRLVPMDTIAESEVEDMDSIDVLFK